jgi:hypothetical protein
MSGGIVSQVTLHAQGIMVLCHQKGLEGPRTWLHSHRLGRTLDTVDYVIKFHCTTVPGIYICRIVINFDDGKSLMVVLW